MLLIAALLLIVVIVTVVIVKNKVEDVPVEGASVKDVLATDVVVDVPVEDVNVIDTGIEDIPMVVAEDVVEVSEEELETLYQVLSMSPRRSSREEGLKVKAIKSRSQGKKTYWPSIVIIIEEETEEELLARKFDEQLYGRRAAKRKANYEDLNPAGRRPRDNKKKGDFRQDRRLKASRQKAVVESRTA